MNAPFEFTPQATEDLDAIWWFIAEDNRDAANRVEAEIVASCRRLARYPQMGARRQDITPLPVRFWTVTNPQLCNRLPSRDGAITGGRRAARKARPEGGSGQAASMNARAAEALNPNTEVTLDPAAQTAEKWDSPSIHSPSTAYWMVARRGAICRIGEDGKPNELHMLPGEMRMLGFPRHRSPRAQPCRPIESHKVLWI